MPPGAGCTSPGRWRCARAAWSARGDPEAQAGQCFANLAAALQSAGADLGQVVKLTCFLTDAAAYPGFAAVRNRLFADGAPASTVVIVGALPMPELLMEVEAVASLG